MSYERKGEDFFISGSVSALSFYGDGSNLTGISGGGGGLTGSGTTNYIAKFTSSGVLADSNIQDYGYPLGVSINYAPQTGVQLAVGNAVNPTTLYSLNNYATSSTTRAGYFENYSNGGTGSKIGIEVSVPTGSINYTLKLVDGRESAGYVLTSDSSGNAYWSAPTGGGTVSQILTQVRNQSGSTMYRGMVVYISGSTGNLPLVTLSQANTETNSARTYGIIKDDIANNGTGYVVAIGSMQNLDTRTTATNPFTSDTLADGDILYLSPTTPGYVTNVKPNAPNHIVFIGTVIRTSPTNGYIEYQIQNGTELDELSDVLISATPSNGQVLAYDTSVNLWKPTTISGGGGGSLAATLLVGNTASTDIDMNQYQIQNVSVIDADGNVGIHTLNMINASLLTLMYNT